MYIYVYVIYVYMFIYVCIYVYMYIHEIYMNLLYNVICIKYICLLIHIYVHTSIDITGMCTASNIQQVWAAASTSRHTLFAVVPVEIRQ